MVGLWDGEVGQGTCWSVGCEHCYGELDGDAVECLCGLRVLLLWNLDNRESVCVGYDRRTGH